MVICQIDRQYGQWWSGQDNDRLGRQRGTIYRNSKQQNDIKIEPIATAGIKAEPSRCAGPPLAAQWPMPVTGNRAGKPINPLGIMTSTVMDRLVIVCRPHNHTASQANSGNHTDRLMPFEWTATTGLIESRHDPAGVGQSLPHSGCPHRGPPPRRHTGHSPPLTCRPLHSTLIQWQ